MLLPDAGKDAETIGVMRYFHPKRILRRILDSDAYGKMHHAVRAFRIARNHSSTLHRLQKKASESRLRVVFYTNEPQKWSYESLYRAFEESPYFDPVVVVVPRYMVHDGKDLTRMTLEEQYAFYKGRGYHVEYGYEKGRYLDIRTFEPDIFFYLQLAEIPGVDDP